MHNISCWMLKHLQIPFATTNSILFCILLIYTCLKIHFKNNWIWVLSHSSKISCSIFFMLNLFTQDVYCQCCHWIINFCDGHWYCLKISFCCHMFRSLITGIVLKFHSVVRSLDLWWKYYLVFIWILSHLFGPLMSFEILC